LSSPLGTQMAPMSWRTAGVVMVAALTRSTRGAPAWVEGPRRCLGCKNAPIAQGAADAFEELIVPELSDDVVSSQVHVLWPTHIEAVSLTSDSGGWESPDLHRRLADHGQQLWAHFRDQAFPRIPKNHSLREVSFVGPQGDERAAFERWQQSRRSRDEETRNRAASGGDQRSDEEDVDNVAAPLEPPHPEYERLFAVVDALGRRYLERCGFGAAESIRGNLVATVSVRPASLLHVPDEDAGAWLKAIFFAKVQGGGELLTMGDPRGHSPPFGQAFKHIAKPGDLVLFPAWLEHRLGGKPVPPAQGDDQSSSNIVYSFSMLPPEGKLQDDQLPRDPTSDIHIHRRSEIDPVGLGLQA